MSSCFSPSIEQRKYFIVVKLTIWVWCGEAIMNAILYFVYRCLYNSGNNRVTTTKYMEYINSIHMVMVKFYCDVITRSHLQLIDTSIDTFFCKLCDFLAKQGRRRKASGG